MPSELLKNLMGQAKAGRLVLPDFQRDFVWKPSDVTKLITSLLNGYPIGGLLFMENPGIYGHRPLDGAPPKAPGKSQSETRLILDGQQRLTSCYRAFSNGLAVSRYPGRYYVNYEQFLKNPKLANSEVEDLVVFVREKEVAATLANTAKEQAAGLFPLDIILDSPRGTDYSKWLSDFTFAQAAGDKTLFDQLSQLQSDFIRRFVERITSYQLHYEEIKKDTSSDVICTVFETINTTGKRLTVFDLLVARCFPQGMNLREMLEVALDRVSIRLFDPTGEGLAPTALPRIVALKEKESARRSDLLELDPTTIGKSWSYAVDALEQALDLMFNRYGCCGERFVPLVDMVAPMAVIIASPKFKHTDDHLRRLDLWYWRSVFSQYYVSSTETKIQRTVRQWVGEDGWLDKSENEPESVREFVYRTSLLEDVSRIDNAVYRGVMSLLLSRKISDLGRDRKQLISAAWEEIADHHIYPKRFLGPYGIKGEAANNVSNRTPILRATNATIANNAPHVYLADPKVVGDLPLGDLLKDHLISEEIVRTPFTQAVFESFLGDRTKRILGAVSDAVGAAPINEA